MAKREGGKFFKRMKGVFNFERNFGKGYKFF